MNSARLLCLALAAILLVARMAQAHIPPRSQGPGRPRDLVAPMPPSGLLVPEHLRPRVTVLRGPAVDAGLATGRRGGLHRSLAPHPLGLAELLELTPSWPALEPAEAPLPGAQQEWLPRRQTCQCAQCQCDFSLSCPVSYETSHEVAYSCAPGQHLVGYYVAEETLLDVSFAAFAMDRDNYERRARGRPFSVIPILSMPGAPAANSTECFRSGLGRSPAEELFVVFECRDERVNACGLRFQSFFECVDTPASEASSSDSASAPSPTPAPEPPATTDRPCYILAILDSQCDVSQTMPVVLEDGVCTFDESSGTYSLVRRRPDDECIRLDDTEPPATGEDLPPCRGFGTIDYSLHCSDSACEHCNVHSFGTLGYCMNFSFGLSVKAWQVDPASLVLRSFVNQVPAPSHSVDALDADAPPARDCSRSARHSVWHQTSGLCTRTHESILPPRGTLPPPGRDESRNDDESTSDHGSSPSLSSSSSSSSFPLAAASDAGHTTNPTHPAQDYSLAAYVGHLQYVILTGCDALCRKCSDFLVLQEDVCSLLSWSVLEDGAALSASGSGSGGSPDTLRMVLLSVAREPALSVLQISLLTVLTVLLAIAGLLVVAAGLRRLEKRRMRAEQQRADRMVRRRRRQLRQALREQQRRENALLTSTAVDSGTLDDFDAPMLLAQPLFHHQHDELAGTVATAGAGPGGLLGDGTLGGDGRVAGGALGPGGANVRPRSGTGVVGFRQAILQKFIGDPGSDLSDSSGSDYGGDYGDDENDDDEDHHHLSSGGPGVGRSGALTHGNAGRDKDRLRDFMYLAHDDDDEEDVRAGAGAGGGLLPPINTLAGSSVAGGPVPSGGSYPSFLSLFGGGGPAAESPGSRTPSSALPDYGSSASSPTVLSRPEPGLRGPSRLATGADSPLADGLLSPEEIPSYASVNNSEFTMLD